MTFAFQHEKSATQFEIEGVLIGIVDRRLFELWSKLSSLIY